MPGSDCDLARRLRSTEAVRWIYQPPRPWPGLGIYNAGQDHFTRASAWHDVAITQSRSRHPGRGWKRPSDCRRLRARRTAPVLCACTTGATDPTRSRRRARLPKSPTSLVLESSRVMRRCAFQILRWGRSTPFGSCSNNSTSPWAPNVRAFFEWKVTLGFSDIIALICPSARLWGSPINRVRMPAEYCAGLLTHAEGRAVFRDQLGEWIKLSPTPPHQAIWVWETCKDLAQRFEEWEDEALANSQVNQNIYFRDIVHYLWGLTRDILSIPKASP